MKDKKKNFVKTVQEKEKEKEGIRPINGKYQM